MALLTDPDSSASSRLFWSADSGETISLHHPSGPGPWLTGGCLILGHGDKIEDKVTILEDGFAAILSPGSWEKLKESIVSDLPVKISAADGGSSLSVEFLTSVETNMDRVFKSKQIILYNPDGQLRQRGFDPHIMAGYVDDLEKAASAVLAGCQQRDACGLLLAVGVKPGKKVKVWCEPVEGSLSQEILERLASELEKVPSLDVRGGPLAFALTGPLWGRNVKEFPEFPAVWTGAFKESGKTLAIPDDLFKLIWRD